MEASRRKAIHDAMVRLSDGDRGAFETLLEELWPVILSFAARGSGQGADAEDIAQEVFYKICSRIADFDRSRDGTSWAFGIASYEIMTHRRRLQRRREVYDESCLIAQLDTSESQEDLLMRREVARAFEQAVGELTDDDRRSLHLFSDPPSGVPSATLRKRKQRALDRLRTVWRHIYGES